MRCALSFEFFPPKSPEGLEKLLQTQASLACLEPEFCSVTYGAGGSTQAFTRETVYRLHANGVATAPHLSCVGTSREELARLLDEYRDRGIRRIVALRGDLPSGSGTASPGELRYASELVAFIREHSGDHFFLEVAAYPEMHPQAASFEADLAHFVNKVKAGANGAITQYFFNADAYFHFVERAGRQGVDIPIVPGIMPITNYSRLARFSDMCGAEIPRWIRKQLEAYGDDVASIKAFGEEVVTRLCEQLLAGGAPGLHFYTLNQAGPSEAIWRNLKTGYAITLTFRPLPSKVERVHSMLPCCSASCLGKMWFDSSRLVHSEQTAGWGDYMKGQEGTFRIPGLSRRFAIWALVLLVLAGVLRQQHNLLIQSELGNQKALLMQSDPVATLGSGQSIPEALGSLLVTGSAGESSLLQQNGRVTNTALPSHALFPEGLTEAHFSSRPGRLSLWLNGPSHAAYHYFQSWTAADGTIVYQWISEGEMESRVLPSLLPGLLLALMILFLLWRNDHQQMQLRGFHLRMGEHDRYFRHSKLAQIRVTTSDRRIVAINQAASRLLRRSRKELLRSSFNDLFGNGEPVRFSSPYGGTLQVFRPDPHSEILIDVIPSVDSSRRSNEDLYLLLDARAIPEQIQQLRQQFSRDSVTGLSTRAFLDAQWQQLIAARERDQLALAVLFIDLNDFKLINDRHGHEYGDIVLKSIAQRLRQRLRGSDVLVRYGGDEFVVILPKVRQQQDVAHCARELSRAVARPIESAIGALKVGCSIGIAMYPEDARDGGTLMRYADAAMYDVKQSGQAGFCFYNTHLQENMTQASELEQALAGREISVETLPWYHPASGEVVGVELQLAWQHPKRGHLRQQEFLHPPAGKRLTRLLTRFLIDTLPAHLPAAGAADEPGRFIALNLRRLGITAREVGPFASALREGTALPWQSLMLVLDTSHLMGATTLVQKQLQALRENGIRICLEHFGENHVSCREVLRLPIDTVHVSLNWPDSLRSTGGLRQQPQAALIALTHHSKRSILLEGEVLQEDIDWLLNHGCQCVRPPPLASIQAVAAAGTTPETIAGPSAEIGIPSHKV